MLSLRRLARDYESSAQSLAEVVPWLGLEGERMVLCKDGSLLVAFVCQGIDLDGLEPSRAAAGAAQMQEALRALDERLVLWSTVHRRPCRPYRPDPFPDPVSERIDRAHGARVNAAAQFCNRHFLSLAFRPDRSTDRLFARFHRLAADPAVGVLRALAQSVFGELSAGRCSTFVREEIDLAVRRFEELLEAFRGALPGVGLTRLQGPDLLAFLHDCCSPASPSQSVRVPPPERCLDTALCDNSVVIGPADLRFTAAERSVTAAALALRDWPASTSPGVLDVLLSAPVELSISQVFRFTQREAAARYIQSVQRFNLNLQKPLRGYLREAIAGEETVVRDNGRAVAADDARDALTALTGNGLAFGYHNATIVVIAEDGVRLADGVKWVTAALRAESFLPLRESIHLWAGWCGTLPGQWALVARWHFVSIANLADLCPLRTVGSGRSRNDHLSAQLGRPCPALTVLSTEFNTPYWFDFHQGDLGHTFVVGPSRGGKSVFVNFLLSQFRRYQPVNVFIFDKDFSCRIPTILQGGSHVDPSAESSPVRLNPLSLLGEAECREYLTGWLELLFTSRGMPFGSAEDRALRQALDSVAGLDPSLWRLRTLYGVLPRGLKDELEPWVGAAPLGRYFDHADDSLDLGSFACIEIGALLAQPRLARLFMDYAFFRIRRLLDGPQRRPTAIYVEEAWFMLESPEYAARIRDWLKTIPKKLAFVVLATQSLEDLAGSAIFPSIADNVPTRIFVPNRNADVHRDVYTRQFGLNGTQVDRIRDAREKGQYYIVTPHESRLVDARFSPDVLACLRSDTIGLRTFSRWRESGQADWVERYLEEMAHVE